MVIYVAAWISVNTPWLIKFIEKVIEIDPGQPLTLGC